MEMKTLKFERPVDIQELLRGGPGGSSHPAASGQAGTTLGSLTIPELARRLNDKNTDREKLIQDMRRYAHQVSGGNNSLNASAFDMLDQIYHLEQRTPEQKAYDAARDLADTQARSAKRERPLSVRELVKLPWKVDREFSRMECGKTIPANLIHDAWEALEKNTTDLGDKWRFIRNKPTLRGYTETPLEKKKREVVIERFDNIPLPKQGALRDTIRSAVTSEKQYLHANHVDLGSGHHFIASQKPMEGEVPGFWRMLAKQKISLVVDLTRSEEVEPRYCPTSGKTREVRDLTVTCTSSQKVRKKDAGLSAKEKTILVDEGKRKPHQLTRLHFSDWPDHGVIDEASLTALANKIEALNPDPASPVLVHCKAGVGRTGTLMAFMGARKRIADEIASGGACHPEMIMRTLLEVIARGRLARGPSFVQNEEQFTLLVKALLASFSEQLSRRPARQEPDTKPLPSILRTGKTAADTHETHETHEKRKWYQTCFNVFPLLRKQKAEAGRDKGATPEPTPKPDKKVRFHLPLAQRDIETILKRDPDVQEKGLHEPMLKHHATSEFITEISSPEASMDPSQRAYHQSWRNYYLLRKK